MSGGSFSTKYNVTVNATISYGQFRFYNINMPKMLWKNCHNYYYRNLRISLLSGTLDLILNLEYIELAIFSDFDFSP